MSNTIAQSLTALSNAKSAISSAITNKGGTVNTGDGLSDFAADIGTIPAGVTLPSVITAIKGGSFTPASNTLCSNYSITHGLSSAPTTIIVWTTGLNSYTAQSYPGLIYCMLKKQDIVNDTDPTTHEYGNGFANVRNVVGSATGSKNEVESTDLSAVFGTTTFCLKNLYGSPYYKSGITYHWIAFY